MGPKKEVKKGVQKRENGTVNETKDSLENAINSDSWKCAVALVVERTKDDCLLLQEFLNESSSGRRREVGVIDFETFVLKILKEFASGELSYKYSFLLNFSSVFQEAVDYMNQKLDIPVLLLVKIVKALLLYLKEDNLKEMEKMTDYFPDPIKAMAERPANIDSIDPKKKDVTKKGENGVKLKPLSVTKQDTELLKRGEKAKSQQCIKDAPQNSYFDFNVLLTGFYDPDFPLELIKANVPLHAVICVNASQTGLKEDPSFELKPAQKHKNEAKSEAIENFWKQFLKNIWDPKLIFHFRDTIFQMYLPPRLAIEKKKLGEFIYREMSYLMYDLSDLKRQLKNYLEHIDLTDVESGKGVMTSQGGLIWPENIPNECTSVPIILRLMIEDICGSIKKFQRCYSTESIEFGETGWGSLEKDFPPSKQAMFGSCTVCPNWSEELEKKENINLLKIYLKTKELDSIYGFARKNVTSDSSEKAVTEEHASRATCNFQSEEFGEIMEETPLSMGGVFRSRWKKHGKQVKTVHGGDYCLYALLMTKISCPYEVAPNTPGTRSKQSLKSNLNFEEMEYPGKPRFTITDGSRKIIQSTANNNKKDDTSRDFFRPEELKVVSPEKLQASSASEFLITPDSKIQTLHTSEIFSSEISKNSLENSKGFVRESSFGDTNDFDFLEFLSKSKLLEKEHEVCNSFDCIDDAYSHWNDCVLLTLHNRKNSQNMHYETFNKSLRTLVGLRDFYEYVLEDEAQWLSLEEESYNTRTFLNNRILPSNSLKHLSDFHFWLSDSLKYQTYGKQIEEEKGDTSKIMTESSYTEGDMRGRFCIKRITSLDSFVGYNVSDMAVQFSGLKTVYYSNDNNVTVQLTERLYGDQELGVHVTEASHTLHLYSYVCPEPHLPHPFKFHVTYKNGIVMAFTRRAVDTNEDIEETLGSKTENSLKLSTVTLEKQIPESLDKYDEFAYDMSTSLPNGLIIQTVRSAVKPCYIKQCYLVESEEMAKLERSRLFLPNGDVIKIMRNRTVRILKANATIVTASLDDLIDEADGGSLNFRRYEVISGEGRARVFEKGEMRSSRRFQVFQNTDMETRDVFFRRRDGTNYALQSNGTLCVEFEDGTKMSSSPIVQDEAIKVPSEGEFNFRSGEKVSRETEPEGDFVFVFTKIIAEHPDYATVMYDGQSEKWKILLPYHSAITIQCNGMYDVDIDKQTELKVKGDLLCMNNSSEESQNRCSFTAHLSVIERKEGGAYCRMKDENGKTFIVEGNSSCYVLDKSNHCKENNLQECESDEKVLSQESELSHFIGSEDLQNPSIKNRKLLRENKYFVLRRDGTGAELINKEDIRKALTKTQKGSLVFTHNIPGSENRYFVLVTPTPKKELKKWRVESILPNPKCEPGARKNERTSSSTYGFPPSWMHPFPKRKSKFVVPEPLTCRVFVETRKTELSPHVGSLDCYYCEITDQNESTHSLIPPEGVEEYLKRLSADDQELLKEIYSLAAASLVNEKKKMKRSNSEKLEHYLEMSRYYVTMREYHKKCIRYHIVPNYFQHPAGMSWLILNELLLKFHLPGEKATQQILPVTTGDTARSSQYSTSARSSEEEIEYDLSVSAGQSFSSLSYRSDLSAETAPAILRTGCLCRCKVKIPKLAASTIPVWNVDTFHESVNEDPVPGICELQENDVQKFRRKECEGRKVLPMSLEDLMYLGLI